MDQEDIDLEDLEDLEAASDMYDAMRDGTFYDREAAALAALREQSKGQCDMNNRLPLRRIEK